MATLKELLSQKEALERQIQETQHRERAEAIAQVRSLMEDYGLTADDLMVKPAGRKIGKTPTKTGSKVPAKYYDPNTGNSWSGRGLQPKWLKAAIANGKKVEDFAVSTQA